MYVLTRQFWNDFRHDPKTAIDTLAQRRERVWHWIFNGIAFWRVVFSEYWLNNCITRASAMSYALLLTLIPLIATTAIMCASIMDIHPVQVERILAIFLPFAPQAVLNYIITFFTNAQKLRGIGIGVLIIVTLGLFGTVEESLNTIWKVSRARTFFARLRTFTMVMVYSPILFFTSFQFRKSIWLGSLPRYLFPFDLLPFLLVVLAFSTLIYFVPNTKVRFRSSFMGGLIAGSLFEIERQCFGMYVHLSIQTKTIYGTFWIFPLFLISLFVGSLFVLFGAQMAYVHQNYRPLLRAKRRWDRRVGDYKTYFTFRMFLDAVTAFVKSARPPSLQSYTRIYELTDAQATGILNWLVHAGLLHKVNGKEHYVPTRDFSQASVKEIFDLIEDQNRQVPALPSDYAREYLEDFMKLTKAYSGDDLRNLTFAELIERLAYGENRAARVSTLA